MIRFLQIIFLVILFRYLWRMVKKYWPSITEVNQKPKSNEVNQSQLKIDKSDIEDVEFTELDEEEEKE